MVCGPGCAPWTPDSAALRAGAGFVSRHYLTLQGAFAEGEKRNLECRLSVQAFSRSSKLLKKSLPDPRITDDGGLEGADRNPTRGDGRARLIKSNAVASMTEKRPPCVHMCASVCMHVCVHSCMRTVLCACMHVCACMCVYMHVYMCACRCACVHACVHMCVCAACTRMCVCVCICALCACVHVCECLHTKMHELQFRRTGMAPGPFAAV